jgi:hypothetical protein
MNISQAIQQLIDLAKADALKAVLPALAAFLTAIAANPSGINIVAQLAKLEIDLIAALPGIEQAILGQLAATISSEAQALLTKVA